MYVMYNVYFVSILLCQASWTGAKTQNIMQGESTQAKENIWYK